MTGSPARRGPRPHLTAWDPPATILRGLLVSCSIAYPRESTKARENPEAFPINSGAWNSSSAPQRNPLTRPSGTLSPTGGKGEVRGPSATRRRPGSSNLAQERARTPALLRGLTSATKRKGPDQDYPVASLGNCKPARRPALRRCLATHTRTDGDQPSQTTAWQAVRAPTAAQSQPSWACPRPANLVSSGPLRRTKTEQHLKP